MKLLNSPVAITDEIAMRSETLKTCQSALLALSSVAAMALPITENPAQAAFYKCVSADGSTSYDDSPCAADEATQRLSKTARVLEGLDCRIARNFAFDVVARMRQDDTAMGVFDAYGGVDSISEDARSLVNYVFTFRTGRSTNDATRIVDLTLKRCEAGLLGASIDQCSSFPEEFISRSGGCIAARENHETISIQRSSLSDAVTDRQRSQNVQYQSTDWAAPTLNAANPR